MKHVLFVCSQNRLRSPSAEQVFASRADLVRRSAGLNHDAEQTMTAELARWADIVFVMEKRQQSRLRDRFGAHVKDRRAVCLDIPDDYAYMDPELVRLLETKVGRLLPIPGIA